MEVLHFLFLASCALGSPQVPQSAPLSISPSFLFPLSHLLTIPFIAPTLCPFFPPERSPSKNDGSLIECSWLVRLRRLAVPGSC